MRKAAVACRRMRPGLVPFLPAPPEEPGNYDKQHDCTCRKADRQARLV